MSICFSVYFPPFLLDLFDPTLVSQAQSLGRGPVLQHKQGRRGCNMLTAEGLGLVGLPAGPTYMPQTCLVPALPVKVLTCSSVVSPV